MSAARKRTQIVFLCVLFGCAGGSERKPIPPIQKTRSLRELFSNGQSAPLGKSGKSVTNEK
ncbi:MAG: hypothetical protein GY739_01630 [Mesoflavibacter sp.]|nr:hypothetical protein [Mesoflavibacter sp.]